MRRFVVFSSLISYLLLTGCGTMPPESSQAVPSYSAQPAPTAAPDVAVLQAQLDEMRRTDDALLMTLWSALGFVGIFVVIVLTINFYVANVRYEHDKRDMRASLLKELRQEQQNRLRFQEIRASKRQRAFERRVMAGQAKSILRMQERTLRMGEYLLQGTKEVEQEIYKAWVALLHQDIRRMTDPDEIRDAGLGVVAHNLLRAAVLIDHEPSIQYALEMMIRSIENGPTDRSDVVRWWEDLEALPPKFTVHVDRIRTLLRDQPEVENNENDLPDWLDNPTM